MLEFRTVADAAFACTRIDLLRHGMCEGGAIFRGHADVALAPEGLAQMRRVAQAAGPWQGVVTSPLRRCQEFAATLAVPLQVDERLREMSFGTWDGCAIDAVRRSDPILFNQWSRDPTAVTPPAGEPLAAMAQRVLACYAQVQLSYRGQKILLVTHGGVIRVLLAHFLSMPLAAAVRLDVPYACLTRLGIFHGPGDDICKLLGHNCFAEE